MSTAVPEILWAQRSSPSEPEKNVIMLTINVPNMKSEATKCDLTDNALLFESTIEADASKGIPGNKYVFDIDFFEEIVPAESKQHLTAKNLYLLIRKKNAQEDYWPRLTKEKVRLHNVKTDFDKWVDEDEQAEKPDDDFGMGGFDPSMLSAMGGGAGGMGGMDLQSMMSQMGGAGAPDFDDEDEEDGAEAEAEAKA